MTKKRILLFISVTSSSCLAFQATASSPKRVLWKDHQNNGPLEELEANSHWTPVEIIKSYLGHREPRLDTEEPWFSHEHHAELKGKHEPQNPELYAALKRISSSHFSHSASMLCPFGDEQIKNSILLTHTYRHQEQPFQLAYFINYDNPRKKIVTTYLHATTQQNPALAQPLSHAEQRKRTMLANQLFFGQSSPDDGIEASFFPNQRLLVVHDQHRVGIWHTTTNMRALQQTLKEALPNLIP